MGLGQAFCNAQESPIVKVDPAQCIHHAKAKKPLWGLVNLELGCLFAYCPGLTSSMWVWGFRPLHALVFPMLASNDKEEPGTLALRTNV